MTYFQSLSIRFGTLERNGMFDRNNRRKLVKSVVDLLDFKLRRLPFNTRISRKYNATSVMSPRKKLLIYHHYKFCFKDTNDGRPLCKF